MFALKIEAGDLDRIVLGLDATAKQAERALRSTLGKMATWLRAKAVKGLSQELHIKQKEVRRRLKSARVKNTPAGASAVVWFGLNPIDMARLGPKKNGGGVTASGYTRKGAFIAKTKGGNAQVFKRTGKARMPIVKQDVSIKQQSDEYIEARLLAVEFETYFFTVFERELKWTQTRT